MPDRTEEEIEQIRKDFIEIKKLWDEKIEKLPASYPNPFNDKSRQEEIDNLHNTAINYAQELINSGKIQSCEALTMIENAISIGIHNRDNPAWWARNLGVEISNSRKTKVVEGVSLDEFVKMLKELPYDSPKLDNVLDEIGTSACDPTASINGANFKYENSSDKFRA